MKKILYFIVFIIICGACSPKPQNLNIMSFNIWVGGGRAPLSYTADVITQSNADIVGIQESIRHKKNSATHIADSLGWHSYAETSRTIISKYPIVDTSQNKRGVKIKIAPEKYVWMFNIHLAYCPYEPYQLNGIEYCGAGLLSTAKEAEESAWKSRGEYVMSVVEDINRAKQDNCPIFLTGDFNEPSYLDWTKRAADAKICIMPVIWTATKAFAEQAGMIDSYRAIYTDEVAKPGHTWTCLPVEPDQKEIMDRIDFVMYNGNITLQNSQIVGEKSALSDVQIENYPSDHRAVLSTFRY